MEPCEGIGVAQLPCVRTVAEVVIHRSGGHNHIAHHGRPDGRAGTADGKNIRIGKVKPLVGKNGRRVQRGLQLPHAQGAEGNAVFHIEPATLRCIGDFVFLSPGQIFFVVELSLARKVPAHRPDLKFRQDQNPDGDLFRRVGRSCAGRAERGAACAQGKKQQKRRQQNRKDDQHTRSPGRHKSTSIHCHGLPAVFKGYACFRMTLNIIQFFFRQCNLLLSVSGE